MSEWKIRRKQGECTGCERAFEDTERHASLLCASEDGLSRMDLCNACWEARTPEETDLFWWFTHFQVSRKKSLNLDLASLERLFFELDGREESKLREIRYLLCLLLMRKRKLRLERVQRGRGGEALIVRRPRRKEEWVVHVFDFGPERIDALRLDLLEILEGSGPASEEEGAKVTEPEASASEEPAAVPQPEPRPVPQPVPQPEDGGPPEAGAEPLEGAEGALPIGG